MPDTVQRLDIIHEVHFAQPAFDLLRDVQNLLRIFYETLAPRCSLNTEHISITSTAILAELLIRIGVFNNAGSVELRADRMSVRLPNVNNPESVAIVKEALALTHVALEKALPNAIANRATYVGHAWVTMDGGPEAAEQLLLRTASPSMPLDYSHWGAETLRYGLRFSSRNETEGWSISMFGEPSVVPGAHLFLSIDFVLEKKALRPIADQLTWVEEKFRQTLTALGLKLPERAATNA